MHGLPSPGLNLAYPAVDFTLKFQTMEFLPPKTVTCHPPSNLTFVSFYSYPKPSYNGHPDPTLPWFSTARVLHSGQNYSARGKSSRSPLFHTSMLHTLTHSMEHPVLSFISVPLLPISYIIKLFCISR